MSLTRKVAVNTAAQVIGKLVAMATSMFLVILLTNYLGTFGYGEYTTIFAYIGFFNVFVDFGLYMITVREISKPDADVEKIVGNLLTIRLIMALAVFSIATGIGFLMPYSMTIKLGIALGSFAIGFVTIGQTFQSIFQSRLKMHFNVIAEIIGRLIVLSITVIMIMMKFGLLYVVLAYIIGDLFQLSFQYFFSRRFVKIRPRFDKEVVKKLLIDATPLGIAGILGMIHFKIDTLLLSFLPLHNGLSNMHEVGIYGVSYKLLEVLVAFPSMFVGSIFPFLSSEIAKKSNEAKKIFQRAFSFLLLVAVPLVVGILVLAPQVILTISGPDFAEAANVLRILIFAVAISFINNLYTHTIISANLQRKLIYVMLSVSLLNLITNLIFIPMFSYFAAATITVLTECYVLILCFWIVAKNKSIMPSFKNSARILISSLVMGLFLFFVNGYFSFFFRGGKVYQLLGLALLFILGCLVYFPTAFFMGVFDKKDLSKIISKREI